MEKQEIIRIWHERDKDEKRTGRTIAVIWDGDMRYVGVSVCSKHDQFTKIAGRNKALSRAQGAKNLRSKYVGNAENIHGKHFPKLFFFDVKKLGSVHIHECHPRITKLMQGMPTHLVRDERQDDHAKAIRSESA